MIFGMVNDLDEIYKVNDSEYQNKPRSSLQLEKLHASTLLLGFRRETKVTQSVWVSLHIPQRISMGPIVH